MKFLKEMLMKNKNTKMYLKYIYFLISILQQYIYIFMFKEYPVIVLLVY